MIQILQEDTVASTFFNVKNMILLKYDFVEETTYVYLSLDVSVDW